MNSRWIWVIGIALFIYDNMPYKEPGLSDGRESYDKPVIYSFQFSIGMSI